MKIKKLVIAAILTMAVPAAAFSYGSNMSFYYQKCSCSKPMKPFVPTYKSPAAVRSYNLDVEQYNIDWSDYIDCVNDYVKSAKADIELIVQSANAAVKETKY